MTLGPTTIIILNYQGSRDTGACLETLKPAIEVAERAGYGPFTTLVIDNGSEVEDVTWLAQHVATLPWVEFIPNAENVGFARGVNQGIRWAADRDADAVLLLNNDTLLEPESIRALCEQSQPRRLLTSLILQYPAHDRIWAFGGRINWGSVPGALVRYGQPVAQLPPKIATAPVVPTGFCTGCVLLIPLTVIDAIGLFDETYFAYVEDVDFAIRARQARISSFVVPASKIYHRSGQATGGGYSARGRYLMGFGTAVCARQHANAFQRLRTHWLIRLAVTVAHFREAGGPNAEAPLAKWRGYRDGLRAELKHPPVLRRAQIRQGTVVQR